MFAATKHGGWFSGLPTRDLRRDLVSIQRMCDHQRMATIHEMHTNALEKGIGVLMAAAGSGIGFALHETAEWRLGISLYPAGAAIVIWCGSFGSGIFRASSFENALQANALAQIAHDHYKPTADQLSKLEDRFEKHQDAQSRWRLAQLWLLLLGAPLYLAAHTVHLIETDRAQACANHRDKSPNPVLIQKSPAC